MAMRNVSMVDQQEAINNSRVEYFWQQRGHIDTLLSGTGVDIIKALAVS